MRKIICDRCGAEHNGMSLPDDWRSIEHSAPMLKGRQYELCGRCSRLLFDWLQRLPEEAP